jgi:plastocyanin
MRSSTPRLALLGIAVATVTLSAVALGASEPGPYVVTAIDYHFHDAHTSPPLMPGLVPGQDLVFDNQGRNLHNVTIPALGFSRDFRPGQQFTIDDVADRLRPGKYQFFCRIHMSSFGMSGVIVIAAK